MKWKAQSYSEAGKILKLLARQGEPLLKKLDEGEDYHLLAKKASNDEQTDAPSDKPQRRSVVAG